MSGASPLLCATHALPLIAACSAEGLPRFNRAKGKRVIALWWHPGTDFTAASSSTMIKRLVCRDQGYNIDDKGLEANFRELQRQFHPDKHNTKGKEVVEIAEQHSARVNEGYGVLKCPLARAKYLVRLCLPHVAATPCALWALERRSRAYCACPPCTHKLARADASPNSNRPLPCCSWS